MNIFIHAVGCGKARDHDESNQQRRQGRQGEVILVFSFAIKKKVEPLFRFVDAHKGELYFTRL